MGSAFAKRPALGLAMIFAMNMQNSWPFAYTNSPHGPAALPAGASPRSTPRASTKAKAQANFAFVLLTVVFLIVIFSHPRFIVGSPRLQSADVSERLIFIVILQ